jgi:hypothetical protein
VATVDIFPLCTKHEFDYGALLPSIMEIVSGYSMVTEAIVDTLIPANVAVDAIRYLKKNFWIMDDLLPHKDGGLVVNTKITATGFTKVGDLIINPKGKILYAEQPNPLLGDLLGYSYKCMAGGDPWTAAAAVQSAFFIIRLISENMPPNLTTTTFEGIAPHGL